MSRHESADALWDVLRRFRTHAAYDSDVDAALRRFAEAAVIEAKKECIRRAETGALLSLLDVDAIVDTLLGPRDDAKETP